MPKGGSQTVQTNLNPGAAAYVAQMRKAAQQAGQGYQPYQQAGALGIGALSGQPDAQQAFMNPYLSQMNPFFQQQRAGAVEGANQQSTLAGAFGGDRSQIGALLAGNQADQTQAQFNYQGFQDAMQRAAQAAQFGFGAIGAPIGLLQQGLGPYGQTQTTTQQTDPWSQLLGLGLTGAGMYFGGPAGAAAGNQFGQQLGGGGGYK